MRLGTWGQGDKGEVEQVDDLFDAFHKGMQRRRGFGRREIVKIGRDTHCADTIESFRTLLFRM